ENNHQLFLNFKQDNNLVEKILWDSTLNNWIPCELKQSGRQQQE
ncbi:hypothetical protein MHK_002489, partial [Candidatus Magnetomorum sp. HK-1]